MLSLAPLRADPKAWTTSYAWRLLLNVLESLEYTYAPRLAALCATAAPAAAHLLECISSLLSVEESICVLRRSQTSRILSKTYLLRLGWPTAVSIVHHAG